MRTNCGCSQIKYEPFEFNIIEKPKVYFGSTLLPNITNRIDELPNKIICDFKQIINKLECGIQPDIETILEKISLVYMNNCDYQYGITKKVIFSNPNYIDQEHSEYVTSVELENILSEYALKKTLITLT